MRKAVLFLLLLLVPGCSQKTTVPRKHPRKRINIEIKFENRPYYPKVYPNPYYYLHFPDYPKANIHKGHYGPRKN